MATNSSVRAAGLGPAGYGIGLVSVRTKAHALEGSADGTRLEGDSREGTAGNRGAGLALDKTGIALPAYLSLTCAHRRADGGRAAVARLPSHMPRRAI